MPSHRPPTPLPRRRNEPAATPPDDEVGDARWAFAGLAGIALFGALVGVFVSRYAVEHGEALRAVVRGQPTLGHVADRPRTTPSGPSIAVRMPSTPSGPFDVAAEPDDPQVRAFRSSYALGDAGIDMPFAPLRRRAELVDVTGFAVERGAMCDVRVLPVDAGRHGWNCVLSVQCEGTVLYPDDDHVAGYGPCDSVAGQVMAFDDDRSEDGDREVHVDVAAHHVDVRERARDDDQAPVVRHAQLRLENS